MSATMSAALRARRLQSNARVSRFKTLQYRSFSSKSDNEDPPLKNPEEIFEDVKASMRNPQRRQATFGGQKPDNMEEIRRNLAQFRIKTAAPGRNPQAVPTDLAEAPSPKETLSFESIRESLRNLRPTPKPIKDEESPLGSMSVQSLRRSLNLQQQYPDSFARTRPTSQMSGKDDQKNAAELMKIYSYEELGKKLMSLRPVIKQEDEDFDEDEEVQVKKEFSIEELRERVKKIREMEDKESEAKVTGSLSFKDLRESLMQLRDADPKGVKTNAMEKFGLFQNFRNKRVPKVMGQEPNKELLERYFHPNNKSAAEKFRAEMRRVWEENRMHKADCGSSQVQIAQLTTKINYLNNVLHKKDKHGNRGKQLMEQRRRKLLKYLRRTNWETYCVMLAKYDLPDMFAPKPKDYFEVRNAKRNRRKPITLEDRKERQRKAIARMKLKKAKRHRRRRPIL